MLCCQMALHNHKLEHSYLLDLRGHDTESNSKPTIYSSCHALKKIVTDPIAEQKK